MSLDYVLLGFLRNQPQSGYQLTKWMDEVFNAIWTADHTQVYRTLHKLEQRGFVEHENVEQETRPDKKVYRITPQGRKHLYAWLSAPYEPPPARNAWVAKLFFATILCEDELLEVLASRRRYLEEQLKELESRLKQTSIEVAAQYQAERSRQHPMGVITLDYGMESLRWELSWLERAEELIKRHSPKPGITADGE